MTSMGNSTAHLWRNWCEHPQKIPGTSWKPQGAQPFVNGCRFQLDAGSPNLHIGNGWKSPYIHPLADRIKLLQAILAISD